MVYESPTRHVLVSWGGLIGFSMLFAELLAANWGLLLPGGAFACFYAGVVFNARAALLIGCLAAALAEVFLGRVGTFLPFLILVSLAARFWRKSGDRRSLANQWVPGAMMSLLYVAVAMAMENTALRQVRFVLGLQSTASIALYSTLAGAFAFPLVVGLFDWLARRAEVPQYHRLAPGTERDHEA